MKKRIAIYHPEGNFKNNPNLSAIVKVLLEADYSVDYFSYYSPATSIADLNDNFRIFIAQRGFPLSVYASSYSLVIGIDEGIIDAAACARMTGSPLGFISYEIFFDAELHNTPQKCIKKRMVEACANIEFAYTQDKIRAKSLSEEYGIPARKIYCMPVAGEHIVPYERSRYLYDLFQIPYEKFILLYMGSISNWAKTAWLIQQADTLPPDWVLVVHGRYGLSDDTINTFTTGTKVFFSREAMETFLDFKRLVQSATCCIALYEPTYENPYCGRNIAEIGMASGKIATSLQHGVPVVINDIGIVSEIVKSEVCGIVIDVKSESPFLNLIDIDLYSSDNCHNAFKKYFDFSNHRETFLRIIKENINKIDNIKCNLPQRFFFEDYCHTLEYLSGKNILHIIFIACRLLRKRVARKGKNFLSRFSL